MKKYFLILLTLFTLSFSSCIVVDDDPYSVYSYPCVDYIDYVGHNQVGGTVYIYFDNYCSETKSFTLWIEDPFGSYSPAAQFILMPVFEDLLRIQAIEFNDQFRKSAFTFNIVNGKIRVFPTPTSQNVIFHKD